MKKLHKVLIAAGLAAALAGCSSMGSKNGAGANGQMGQNGEGTYSQGLGADGSFSWDNLSPAQRQQLLAQRVYYFKFDSAQIREQDIPAIKAQAHYLLANPNKKVLLAGNTDARGSREYNVALGMRRSDSVANILKMQGVSNKQIREISYGQEKPAVLGNTEEAYQKNRRVQLEYEN